MFNKGDVVKVDGNLFPQEWTVLDAEDELLGCRIFSGHSGPMDRYKGTVWEDHCWHIPTFFWKHSAPLIQENE